MSDAEFSQQRPEASNEAVNFSSQESSQEFEYCLDDILASDNFEPDPAACNAAAKVGAYGGHTASQPATTSSSSRSRREAAEAFRNEPPTDRRKRRRALISAPVRVRGINVTDAVVDEISTTIDVSRAGILFLSSSPNYARGMEVAVMFPYSTAPAVLHAEQEGRVVRAFQTPDGAYAVAIALGEGVGEDIVDACGRKLADSSGTLRPSTNAVTQPAAAAPLGSSMLSGSHSVAHSFSRESNSKRPLVLAVDSDDMARVTLKTFLAGEGYDVMAVGTCNDAREVLNLFTPALVIAEVEGEGLPGYELCAHIKQSPRLKQIPVVLTTCSGYPSDYSSAHSLGAVVCMTKPYKLERLGHVARLLAPPPAEFCAPKTGAAAPRTADPSRRCGYTNTATSGNPNGGAAKLAANALRRLKFPSFR